MGSVDPVQQVIKSQVGKVVAFVVTPIIAVASGAAAVWANKHLGLDLNGTEVATYVTATVVGVSLAGVTWLFNRGKYEIATVISAAQGFHQEGAPQPQPQTTQPVNPGAVEETGGDVPPGPE